MKLAEHFYYDKNNTSSTERHGRGGCKQKLQMQMTIMVIVRKQLQKFTRGCSNKEEKTIETAIPVENILWIT